MKKVLDAHALMVYLEREPSFEKIRDLFISAMEKDEDLLMTSVNYGEVLYSVLRSCGQAKTREIEKVIDSLPIDIVVVDRELASEAAKIKAFKKMSFADCMAAALAKIHKAEVVTGDKEFHEVEKEITIHWI